MGMGWIKRKFFFDMTDDDLFVELMEKLDQLKIVVGYRPIIAVEFPTDAAMPHFILEQDDKTGMVFPVGSRTMFVDGDERAKEIQDWIKGHAPDGKMSVVADGTISFADSDTLSSFETMIAESAGKFGQPVQVW